MSRSYAGGMDASDKSLINVAHPMPDKQHAALLASMNVLLARAEQCFPVEIQPSGEQFYIFTSWEITRAAFIARMASTLRHLSYLAPSYSRLDGMALARTLVDHSITYAWIGADPKARLPMFVRDGMASMRKKHARLATRKVKLIEPDLLGYFEAYCTENPEGVGKLPKLAREADEAWRARVTDVGASLPIPEFAEMYDLIYDQYAGHDHATTLGLTQFTHTSRNPSRVVVNGEPVRDPVSDLRPYWIATFAFAEALVIANRVSGYPRIAELKDALQFVATLRGLDATGRLRVTQTAAGLQLDLAESIETHGGV